MSMCESSVCAGVWDLVIMDLFCQLSCCVFF